MSKRFFRRYLPSPERVLEQKSLRFLHRWLGDANLWHLNRRSLSGAAFIGVFSAMLPMPMQMAVAAILAIRLRCNLPLSAALVWLSNPLTFVPLCYANYRVGAWLLGLPPYPPDGIDIHWLVEQLAPLWAGSLATGLLGGLCAWLAVRWLWRLSVIIGWRRRSRQRRRSNDNQP